MNEDNDCLTCAHFAPHAGPSCADCDKDNSNWTSRKDWIVDIKMCMNELKKESKKKEEEK